MERARRRCRQEWREITVRWRRTGLTAVEFARQEGLNPSTFAGWRSEFAREDKAQSPPLTLVPIRYPGLTLPRSAGPLAKQVEEQHGTEEETAVLD